jgi:hypothetical protein
MWMLMVMLLLEYFEMIPSHWQGALPPLVSLPNLKLEVGHVLKIVLKV